MLLLNGLEMRKEIRSDSDTHETTIIPMSADYPVDPRSREPDEILAKLFDALDIAKSIARYLAGAA